MDMKTSTEPAISSIESSEGYWSIYPVIYQGRQECFDLLKSPLENGASKTYDQWSAYSKQATLQGKFHVGDFPLYNSLFTTLFRSKDGPNKVEIANIQAFLKDNLFKHWLTTLTRIRYTPSGKDVVIHNPGLKDQYEVQEDIVGPNEWVRNARKKAPYNAILGTDNTAEIQAVYNWLTGKDVYLWRVNAKPDAIEERVARFDANSDSLLLYCNVVQLLSDPALGVRRASGASKSGVAAQKITAQTLEQLLARSKHFPTQKREAFEKETRALLAKYAK